MCFIDCPFALTALFFVFTLNLTLFSLHVTNKELGPYHLLDNFSSRTPCSSTTFSLNLTFNFGNFLTSTSCYKNHSLFSQTFGENSQLLTKLKTQAMSLNWGMILEKGTETFPLVTDVRCWLGLTQLLGLMHSSKLWLVYQNRKYKCLVWKWQKKVDSAADRPNHKNYSHEVMV